MSINFRYFPDVFKNVIDKVRLTIDPIVGEPPNQTGGVKPVFKYGNYDELVSSSKIDDINHNVKYPLVWLVWTSDTDTQVWTNKHLYTIAPRVFLLTKCEANESTDSCYTNHIKAILNPIWDEIQKQLSIHDNVLSYIYSNCNLNDHPHWGSNDKLEMFDTLSAIEINFKELIIVNH